MKINYLILIVIVLCPISFTSGIVYCSFLNKKFYDSDIGMPLIENRKRWGRPDRIDTNSLEIIDTYNSVFPHNEYKFFYKKNDSLLYSRWKEY